MVVFEGMGVKYGLVGCLVFGGNVAWVVFFGIYTCSCFWSKMMNVIF